MCTILVYTCTCKCVNMYVCLYLHVCVVHCVIYYNIDYKCVYMYSTVQYSTILDLSSSVAPI